MSYIIETSGKQYKADCGQKIILNNVNAEIGELIDLKVIANLKSNDFKEFYIKGKVEAHIKGKKVIIFKKKRRHGYERKRGYRSLLTVVSIVDDENI